jgi:FkbM family methyltransferase
MGSTSEGVMHGVVEHIMVEGGTLGTPGSEYALESMPPENPAMSVRIYKEDDGKWEPTAYSIGMMYKNAQVVDINSHSMKDNDEELDSEVSMAMYDSSIGKSEGMEDETAFTVGSSLIAAKKNIDTGRSREVNLIDLIEFLRSNPKRVSLIKLDVEGAEIAILEKILQEKAWGLFDRLYVETHETKIPEQLPALEKIKASIEREGIDHIKLNWV